MEANKNNTIINCERCGARCKVTGPRNSDAKMLRRSKEPKGLCVNCAVHNWLRNTYPVNLLLASSGPQVLRFEHIRQQFAGIMQVAMADANPDEIDWEAIIDNWERPFKNKVKATAMNPASQDVLDMEPEMQARQENFFREEMLAKEEGFESLFEKQQAEQDRIIEEELLPLLRKQEDEE